jgi:polyisoprenoid-binding protein YceI
MGYPKTAALLLAAVLEAIPALTARHAEPERYAVRAAESAVTFTVQKLGHQDVTGRFPEVSGLLHYDAGRPEASRVNVRVAVASVDTGTAGRDVSLRTAAFFDAGRYPQMTFVSTRVTPTGKDTALVAGDLTIRGVTRPIEVPVRLRGLSSRDGLERAGFEADFTLDRRDFGVRGAPALVGNEVRVHLSIGASRGRT